MNHHCTENKMVDAGVGRAVRERHSTSAQLTGAWPGDCVEPIAKDESTYAMDAPLLLTALVARSSSSSCSPTYVLSLGSCPFGDSRLPT